MLSACAGPQVTMQSEPFLISISEIHKDPWRYDSQWVRVGGTFTECMSYQCEICEGDELDYSKVESLREETDFDICMIVRFNIKADDPLSLLWTVEQKEKAAQFKTVTLEALYDATCSGAPEPGSPANTIVFCLDRGSELEYANVVAVKKARPATQGTIVHYGTESLLKPSREDDLGLKKAFQSALPRRWGEIDMPQTYTYLEMEEGVDDDANALPVGGVCICTEKQCIAEDWPTLSGHLMFDIPENPYRCYEAEKVDGTWRFPIQY